MATFTAGTSFVDGVTGDVTAAKLGALVTNAVPLPNLITDRTAETAVATDDLLVISNTSSAGALNKMTVANLMKAELTGTINSTSGTIATFNSTTPTFLGAITASTNTINVGSGQIYKDASGNVGIGISSPNAKLDVNGNILLRANGAEGGEISFLNTGNATTGLTIDIAGTDNPRIISGSTNSILQIGQLVGTGGIINFFTTAIERLRIDASGNVGIGTASPSAKLSISFNGTTVAGSDYKNTDSGSGGQNYAIFYRNTTTQIGSITGTGSAISYNTSSDYRLKTNLDPVVNGIERIKQLPVYRFNWINDQGANKVDGFVAHEAQAIVPESVTGEKDSVDADGNPIYQGIDQSKIVPLLTAALKEAIAKIETLESKVTALEAA